MVSNSEVIVGRSGRKCIDVEKSSSHHLSQAEIADDRIVSDTSMNTCQWEFENLVRKYLSVSRLDAMEHPIQ